MSRLLSLNDNSVTVELPSSCNLTVELPPCSSVTVELPSCSSVTVEHPSSSLCFDYLVLGGRGNCVNKIGEVVWPCR